LVGEPGASATGDCLRSLTLLARQERRWAVENSEECLKQLQTIETGWAPEGESALLRDLLTPSHGSANRNAYKHRLHALRRDYVNAHLRTLDLEDQLSQARLRILRLEARVQHLSGTLEQMRARLVWKVVERC